MDTTNHTINRNAALKIAEARVLALGAAAGDTFQILPSETRELEHGWLFFFNSADYVRTHDPMFALAGNGPVLVRRTGQVAMLPSAAAWQDMINDKLRQRRRYSA